ncbi:MAG TPA: zinc-binding dehydrogenase, partial [Myxococcaceae bacterium]
DAFKQTGPDLDLGAETASEVVAVGAGVTHLKPGQHVLTLVVGGGFREYLTLPADKAIPIPQASPALTALMVNGLTASIGLKHVGELKRGETVLITAAAGGVGHLAVQLAKMAGAHVVGVCGTDEKASFLQGLGCDRTLNYRKDNLHEVLKREYPRGIDVIFEMVGGEVFDTLVHHVAEFGRLVVCGYISEYRQDRAQKVLQPRIYEALLWKSASVRGFIYFRYESLMAPHLTELVGLVLSGKLNVVMDPTRFVGIESCVDAVEHLHSGKNIGKVLVQMAKDL